jgi:YHS domain-containing protein
VKRIFGIIIVLCLILTLNGCAKIINTEYEDVEVTVIDSYYDPEWFQPAVLITHSATYEITVEYDGKIFYFSGSEIYDRYKDKVGETVTGVLATYTYDDGSTKKVITELK